MLGDDAELTAAVLAAQDGDEDAFRAVYRAVQPRLLGYIRTLVGELDAEDVASEAWLQIARDLDRFSGDADRFRGWAARIARNRSLDHLRMRSRRPAIGGDETELTTRAAESDTAGDAIEALDTDRTMSLIAQLPQDQAEAVVLRVVVGLDAKSAAQTLGKRPGAVRTAAHRGLKRLAELLGAEHPGTNRADGGFPVDGASADDAPASAPLQAPAPAPVQATAQAPAQGADDGAGQETGGGAGLGAVPAQRPGRGGPAAPAGVTPGVTHLRPWTQKDM
ncbi:RNA polymerase sigma factor [Streptomyces sp. NPDC098077]|uniref:RNA polymerase sigma factor n=1 Tax=Streptomyces sp. NPDC098077 TaxID=3366093 RepID=UPI00383024DC